MTVFSTPKIASTALAGLRRTCLKATAAAAVLVAVAGGATAAPAQAASTAPRTTAAGTAPDLVSRHWSFTSASQLTKDWMAHVGHGYGVDMTTADPDLVRVQRGVATLTARRATDGSWRGPRYLTKQKYLYGTFTARIKLPKGQGAWPALWLCDGYGPNGQTPTAEIDLMESVNNTSTLFSTLHSWSGPLWQRGATAPLTPGWHTYRLDWSRNSIAFALDGRVVHVYTHSSMPSWPFDVPMNVIMNVSVGGSWAGAPTAATPAALPMQVDYLDIKSTHAS